MPRATVDISKTRRFDLKTLPEGYVVIHKMSYGQYLQRQEMAMQMQMTSDNKGTKDGLSMDIKSAQLEVTIFDFKTCIAEHNLTDENDKQLDFNQSYVITILDPQVGQEIGDCIDSMNQYSSASVGNSLPGSVESSSIPDTTPSSPSTIP